MDDYVANLYFKCFICFKHMLQLFHLSVAKVDIDVGLLSEEERASAGVMAASMWGRGASHTSPVWKTRGVIRAAWKWWVRSGVEEAGKVKGPNG